MNICVNKTVILLGLLLCMQIPMSGQDCNDDVATWTQSDMDAFVDEAGREPNWYDINLCSDYIAKAEEGKTSCGECLLCLVRNDGNPTCEDKFPSGLEFFPVGATPLWFMAVCLLLYGACFTRKKSAGRL